MENNTLNKTLDTIGNVTKLAANLSEPKKDIPKPVRPIPLHQTDDNSNKASTGSQNIQIHMDTGKKKEPKPVEKHIHEFPENRPLTDQECELALKKAQMDYELRKSEQTYCMKAEDRQWQHRMEVEKKSERRRKIRNGILGVFAALGVGAVGYSFYADYRDGKNRPVVQKAIPEATAVKADGEVK